MSQSAGVHILKKSLIVSRVLLSTDHTTALFFSVISVVAGALDMNEIFSYYSSRWTLVAGGGDERGLIKDGSVGR